MSNNIYDRLDFFTAYSQLDRSRNGLAGAPEWPALQAMLPIMQGLDIIDLGCGFGWFARWARQNGAASILAVDLSEKMLAQARSLTTDPAITYEASDLEQLSLPPSRFDLVYSSLAFHYVSDASRLFQAIHSGLKPGGRLVFSTEHPIYMAASNPAWTTDTTGQPTWPVDHYFAESPRTTDWLAKGIVKHHRTIGTTLTLLIQSGFIITHVQEFCPTDEQIEARPELASERHRPMFLLVGAVTTDSTNA